MIIHDEFEQRTEEWEKIRIGKFTGTDFQTVANGKKDTIETLCYKKASEIITGKKSYDSFSNRHTERGIEKEDEAREMFQLETGLLVKTVGFIERDIFSGVSPDGLIGDNSGIEIKCKDYHTHLYTLLNGDNSYMWQIQGNMFISNRESWYFCSYNEDFPIDKRIYICEHKLIQEKQEKIKTGLEYCINRVKEILSQYGYGYENPDTP